MNVLWPYMTLHYLDVVPRTDLPYQLPDATLEKVLVRGGAPQRITNVRGSSGATWLADGTIVISSGAPRRLMRFPETGGVFETLTTQDFQNAEGAHTWPERLPRSDAILFTVESSDGELGESKAAVLSLETGEHRVVLQRAHRASYVPTGHLVFARQQGLWAVPFDVERLETTGPEALIVPNIQVSRSFGDVPYAFSENNLLAYASGEGASNGQELVIVDRSGRAETILGERSVIHTPRISPDGSRLAVSVVGSGQSADLWIYPINGEPPYRLTVDANTRRMAWSPDGTRLVYESQSERALLVLPADGSVSEPEILLQREPDGMQPSPYSWSPDGTAILFYESSEQSNWDIWVQPLDGEPRVFLQTEFYEGQPVFSPNGRFVAYVSTRTGSREVYIRPYPEPGAPTRVSRNGGEQPAWSRDGAELFFIVDERHLMVAPVVIEPELRVGEPSMLLEDLVTPTGFVRRYDVGPDGRFVTMRQAGRKSSEPLELTIVEGIFEELKRLAPAEN